MNSSLKKKCSKIKIVLTDVDGVLTDGGMYYSSKGDIMKKFHARDGMGVTLLRKHNIPTIIVTKEKNSIIKNWAKKMKIKKIYDGINKKELVLVEICKNFKVNANEVAYIGDDVNDLGLMNKVGLSAVPKDAIKKAQQISHYVCKNNGGRAAFREFLDIILEAKHFKS